MGPIAEGLHGFAHAQQRDPSSLRSVGMTDLGRSVGMTGSGCSVGMTGLGRYAGMAGSGEWQAWGALLG